MKGRYVSKATFFSFFPHSKLARKNLKKTRLSRRKIYYKNLYYCDFLKTSKLSKFLQSASESDVGGLRLLFYADSNELFISANGQLKVIQKSQIKHMQYNFRQV